MLNKQNHYQIFSQRIQKAFSIKDHYCEQFPLLENSQELRFSITFNPLCNLDPATEGTIEFQVILSSEQKIEHVRFKVIPYGLVVAVFNALGELIDGKKIGTTISGRELESYFRDQNDRSAGPLFQDRLNFLLDSFFDALSNELESASSKSWEKLDYLRKVDLIEQLIKQNQLQAEVELADVSGQEVKLIFLGPDQNNFQFSANKTLQEAFQSSDLTSHLSIQWWEP